MDSAQFDDFDELQVKSKKDFDDCTGFVESDDGENGPVTVSFDKVLPHDDDDDDDGDLVDKALDNDVNNDDDG